LSKKLHNEELHNLYSSPSIIRMMMSRMMRWAAHVVRLWRRGMHVGKSEGKRPLGGPRHRWVNNITMDLGEIGWDGVDWIDVVQDRN
jgi:hypothetical protein